MKCVGLSRRYQTGYNIPNVTAVRDYFRYSTSLDAHPKSTRWRSDQSPITISTTLSQENPTLSQGNNSQRHLQLVHERAIYRPGLAHVQGEALKHLILLLSDLLKNL